MEIPGVITRPEHKLPTHRYGIDRQSLVNAGISSEEVDRIYRMLFVHSVGYFELLKKILSSSNKNFKIITSIWKVFQILLEYCCKTDYRTLIQDIVDKHNEEMGNIELAFKERVKKYTHKAKVLNENLETLREYND